MKLWTIKEVCELARISRTTFWRIRQKGDVQTVMVGGSPRVPHPNLVAWLGHDPLKKDASITIEKTITNTDSTVHSKTRIEYHEQPTLFDR